MALIEVSGIITPGSKPYSWVYMGTDFSRLVKKLIFGHRLKLNNGKGFYGNFLFFVSLVCFCYGKLMVLRDFEM